MANTVTRRPLPAVVSLVALLLLTGLVWWRVLHRGGGADASPAPCPTTSSSSSSSVLPQPSAVTVSVLNSTTRTGLGATVRKRLVAAGFQVPNAAANDRAAMRNKITSTAQIRYGPKGAAGARLLHYYLPGSTLVAKDTRSALVVVSVGTRYRSIATSATVARAMRSAGVTLAGDSPSPTPSAGC